MTELTGTTAGGRLPRYGGDVRISEDEWVRDERTGELRLSEKGITRQKEDILALARKLGVEITKWYPENDTTAFKKKRIVLPNGRSVWRVIRPEFRKMLADYEDGEIDGVIFYDIDRLARQPRDLEDLIDLVEHYGRPVATVTGEIDLRTSNGRAMARVLVAMASKSSEDTSRRVARARLQEAQQGRSRSFRITRRFGYTPDGQVVEAEAGLIRAGARRILAGGSWAGLVKFFTDSGITPVTSRDWSLSTIRQIYLTASIAGIAVYDGAMRTANQGGARRNRYLDPESVALRDAAGNYIMGEWPAILTVADWEALVDEYKRRRAGKTFSAAGTKKHLLSGLLRCGCIRPDGSVCNRRLTGTIVKGRKSGPFNTYKCPGKNMGGCGGVQRNAAKLDKLIEDLLFAHIEAHAPDGPVTAEPDASDPDVIDLADVQQRLLNLRMGYAAVPRTVSDDTMFNVVPQLEASERELKGKLAKKAKTAIGRAARGKSPADVRREWDEAIGDVGTRRAILSRYLKAVVVRKSRAHGTAQFDYSAIEPIWRDDSDAMPGEYLA